MVAATGCRISLSFAAPRLLIPASTARAFATASAFFPDIDKVRYEGPSSRNPLAFKQYAEDEVVAGRTMKEWLRFSIAYWHTWRGNGGDIFGLDGTINRPWEDRALSEMDMALRRVDVNAEFCEKVGAPYYCFHDLDVRPEGATQAESDANFDIVAERLGEVQAASGLKLLWGTANLFTPRRYMNGAATNPDPAVFARAAASVKKCLEVTHRLGGENYVLWGGREGYQSILNTNVRLELDNLARFLSMVAEHKHKVGFRGPLLLEPKPREPMAHQYDYDAATVLGFLRQYGLQDEFALNLEANHGTLAGHTGEHETAMAAAFGKLGSIDANRNEAMLGWDTDMFPNDVGLATYIMDVVLKQGGLAPGGLNFDAKVRRESTDVEDLFIGHINGMDTYARGLRNAARMQAEGTMGALVDERYAGYERTAELVSSLTVMVLVQPCTRSQAFGFCLLNLATFPSELPQWRQLPGDWLSLQRRLRINHVLVGRKIVGGRTSLEELAALVADEPEPQQRSAKVELYESIFLATMQE